MKTADEWAEEAHGAVVPLLNEHEVLRDHFAQAMAEARRAALEEAARELDARARGHSTTVGNHYAAGHDDMARHFTSIQRETEKCARDVRALLDDAGTCNCERTGCFPMADECQCRCHR